MLRSHASLTGGTGRAATAERRRWARMGSCTHNKGGGGDPCAPTLCSPSPHLLLSQPERWGGEVGQREEQKLKANPPLGQQWGRDASHPFCRTAAPHQHSTAWIWGGRAPQSDTGEGVVWMGEGPWVGSRLRGSSGLCVLSPALSRSCGAEGEWGEMLSLCAPEYKNQPPPPPQLLPAAAQSQCVVQKPNTKPPAPRFPPQGGDAEPPGEA